MIIIKEKTNCCGCSACASVCPKRCILMEADKEGFLYPVIDDEKCIKCNQCITVCPQINIVKEKVKKQYGYIVQNKNEQIRKESTSGGAFTAIAQYVIKEGGVVFGACYDEEFQVIHDYVETEEALTKFRNSKYVQSTIGDTFRIAKRFLQQDRLVCFSGTPCQIEGLKKYLQRQYDNLITVDVVCHAVPSPLIWNKYLTMQKQKYSNQIKNILFRDKQLYGYQYSTMSIYGEEKLLYYNGIDSDAMLRAFFSNICDRPSCYSCKFKKRYRESDFTIWDCFNSEIFDCHMNENQGVTRVLIHSMLGKQIFDRITNKLFIKKIKEDELVENVKEMFYSVPMHPDRNIFFEIAQEKDGEKLFERFFKKSVSVFLERSTRKCCYHLGIYSLAKKIYLKLRKEND